MVWSLWCAKMGLVGVGGVMWGEKGVGAVLLERGMEASLLTTCSKIVTDGVVAMDDASTLWAGKGVEAERIKWMSAKDACGITVCAK